MTYVFDEGGDLTSATSALDDMDQASPRYLWLSFPRDGDTAKPYISRMEAISDPVAGRQMTLRYAGFNPALPCPNVPSDPNLGPTPSGKLCQVDNWDGTYTRLWYNPNGQLAKVVEDPTPALGNPLASVSDFGYDTLTGKLNTVRDPFANDAVAVPAISATHVHDDDTSRTLITYTDGRVTHVTLPVPYDGTTGTQPPRPGRGYEYPSAIETRVQVDFPDASLKPNGFNRKVTYDLAGRVSADFDATANTDSKATSFSWDEGDRMTAQLGPADTEALRRRSTTIYDGDAARVQRTGRVSDTYGPAPSTCFGGDGRSNGSCTIPPPHTATEFDRIDGVLATGLAISTWANDKFKDAPKSRSQASPDANGVLVGAGLGTGVSSVRYTGEINLPTVGTYGFSLTAAGSARLFVDDTVVADASAGGTAAGSVTIANTTPPTTGWHRFRIDFAAVTGTTPHLEVAWTPNGASRALVAADLGPRFANPTKTTRDDNLGVPAMVTATTYESLSDGVVKHDIVDPNDLGMTTGHLNLVTTSGNETPGVGRFRRPTSLTLPANVPTDIMVAPDPTKSTLYTYYTVYIAGPPPVDAQTNAAVPDCGVAAGVNQAGRVHTITTPSPDGSGNGRRVKEVVYDAAGRVVASRMTTDAVWTCTGYDARGRITSISVPAFGGPAPAPIEPAHTFSYSYAVGTSPLQATITEGSGVITTKVDLLGRVLSYSDIWAKTTTSTYDRAGRLTATNGPVGPMTMDYDAAGRITRQTLDSGDLALATYNGAGELATATYPGLLAQGNGTALASIERHPTGAVTRLQWTGPGSTALADDVVTRSQSGKVVDETIDGTDTDPTHANFTYDAAGRLTHAAVPAHSLDYAFAATGGCGTQTSAGRNANRTSLVDNGGAPTTYCYNLADQLTSSSDTSVGPVTYDSHGNTATIGNQTLLYDGADRHMATMFGGTEIVRYLRDPTGRITSRTEGASIVHYGSAGPTDSSAFTMDATNTTVTERTIRLVGGVLLTKRGGVIPINDVWGYPNIHGDIVATANYLGVKQAAFAYDPFGNGAAPDNSAGNLDYGWLGQHQRPLEHAGSLATIEMGARQYMPSIGRFVEVDPVEGGNENDYVYPADPVNGFDLDGKCGLGNPFKACDENHKGATNIVSGAFETVNDYANGSNDPNNVLVRGAHAIEGGVSAINRNVFTCKSTTFTRLAGAISLFPPFGGGGGAKQWAGSATSWLNFGVGNLVSHAASGGIGNVAVTGLKSTVIGRVSRLSTILTVTASVYDASRRLACRGR